MTLSPDKLICHKILFFFGFLFWSSMILKFCNKHGTITAMCLIGFKSDLWVKSRGRCTTKLLPTWIIELLNSNNNSTHVLCISRKLRFYWVELSFDSYFHRSVILAMLWQRILMASCKREIAPLLKLWSYTSFTLRLQSVVIFMKLYSKCFACFRIRASWCNLIIWIAS